MKLKDLINERTIVEKVDTDDHSNGTYVGVKFSIDSRKKLKELCDNIAIPEPCDENDFHCTVMYSTKPLPKLVEDEDGDKEFDPPIVAQMKKFHIFDTQDGNKSLVILLECEYLTTRHEEISEKYDAEYPHDEYRPHVTLSYNVGDIDLDDIDYELGELEIVDEYVAPIDLDWV